MAAKKPRNDPRIGLAIHKTALKEIDKMRGKRKRSIFILAEMVKPYLSDRGYKGPLFPTPQGRGYKKK